MSDFKSIPLDLLQAALPRVVPQYAPWIHTMRFQVDKDFFVALDPSRVFDCLSTKFTTPHHEEIELIVHNVILATVGLYKHHDEVTDTYFLDMYTNSNTDVDRLGVFLGNFIHLIETLLLGVPVDTGSVFSSYFFDGEFLQKNFILKDERYTLVKNSEEEAQVIASYLRSGKDVFINTSDDIEFPFFIMGDINDTEELTYLTVEEVKEMTNEVNEETQEFLNYLNK